MLFFSLTLENIVNKDVFETFYLRRPSKSSHSSKSSNDSIRGVDDSAPPFTKSNVHLLSKDKDHPNVNKQPSSIRSEKYKPQKYLFGSSFDRKTKYEREKENVYEDNHNSATNNSKNNNNNNNSNRFKTITIKNLRRSFRDTFLDSSKPAKGREHQQLWFIDVKDKRDEAKDNVDKQNKNKSNWQSIDDDDKYLGQNCRVKRNETFRIDNNSKGPDNNAVSRRETFRINRHQSPIRSHQRNPSVDSNSFTINHHSPNKNVSVNRKMVPIAITAPYSASNDTDYYSNSLFSQNHQREAKNREYNRYADDNDDDSDHEETSPQYMYATKHLSSPRNQSPMRYSKQHTFHVPIGSTSKTKSQDNNRITQRNVNDGQDSFENRSILERQSFNNFNTAFERIRRNRPYTSLRNKSEIEQTDPYNRDYDVVDANENNDHSSYITSQSKPLEPWRKISSRKLFDSENRSFVPYRSDYRKNDDSPNKTNNSNRTTINIKCDYNSNSKRGNAHPQNFQRNEPAHTHTFSIPLTANDSPSTRSTKPNKNRSVNFPSDPSVECEVRLISPNYNYDNKPRRKLKPANDWTYNKVHL